MEKSTENKSQPINEPIKDREGMSVKKVVKEGYKKTKIGWIPEDWRYCPIKSFAKVSTGSTPKTSENENYGDEYLFASPADLGITKDIIDTNKKLSKIGFSKSRNFPKGSVLFTCIGSTIGKTGIATVDLTSNQQINAIQPSNKHDNEYLYYILSHISSKIKILAGEQAVPIINKSEFESQFVTLPPLPEQRKIAEILSTWDKAIEHTQKLIAQLKLRRKGLMQQLLSGKTRLKEFSGEWKEVQLKDIANRLTTKNGELNDNVVTISAQRGFVKQEDFFKKRVASDTLSGYYLIKRGQFAYNKSYSNGYPMGAFKRLDNLDKAVVTTLYICFNLKNNVDSDFLVNFFEAGLMVRNLMKIAQEGGRAHGLLNIALNDFFSLKMTIPEIEEQQAIAKVLTTADNEIKKQEAYLAQLQAQKKGLMQKLLTGEVRVKVN
ncbi:restriction endonuclease subunit S [Saccharicrinis sp. FJH2]|uniref:restriction endonuclease subunit S n=1 Tax=Saccharicrinis sp. FJH65 TaxID=3344659 RepID=UPI0035F3A9B9